MINIDTRLLATCDADETYFMLTIAKYMGKENFAFPSIKTISDNTGWSEKKVRRVKKKCIDKSLLEVVKRHRENGGRSSDGYRIKTEYVSVYVNLKDKGDPPYPKDTPPPTQNVKGGTTQNVQSPPTQNVKGKEVLTSEVLTTELCEHAHEEIQPYEKAYHHLVEYFTENIHLINGVKTQSQYRGDIAPILKDYLINLQEKGEWFRLRVPADADAHYRWVSSILAGVTKWAAYRKKNSNGQSEKQAAPVPVYDTPQKRRQPISKERFENFVNSPFTKKLEKLCGRKIQVSFTG